VFEPYVAAASCSGGGTGLGLYSARTTHTCVHTCAVAAPS
jgi:hypothetical protein